jgi:ribose transport system permease protein
MNTNFSVFLKYNFRTLIALAMLAILFAAYVWLYPAKFSLYALTILANQGVVLSFVAIAQALAVLTAGLDLSVGAIMALSNAIASALVDGSSFQVSLGVLVVLLVGITCGLVNGLIVVYGRLQPIIVTLATGAVYTGFALFIRPIPGGSVNEAFSDALTYDLFGLFPVSPILLFGVLVLVWIPLKRSLLGRGIYAIGSAQNAAYMSGIQINRSKLAAYSLGGLFSSIGGLYLAIQTLSGDATIGFSYTLTSIASVVIGGTLLSGGVGGAIGAVIGAFVLRTINSVMYFAGAPPLAQPLFEGAVLLAAVSLGAIPLLRLRNRLDVLGS